MDEPWLIGLGVAVVIGLFVMLMVVLFDGPLHRRRWVVRGVDPELGVSAAEYFWLRRNAERCAEELGLLGWSTVVRTSR